MKPEPRPTFEEALRSLEKVVDDLERGDSALATALAGYESGVTLLAHCQAELDHAERSVALLTGVTADGTPVTAPFDSAATTPPPAERAKPTTTRSRKPKPPEEPEPFIPF